MKLIIIPLLILILVATTVQLTNFAPIFEETSGEISTGVDNQQISDLGATETAFTITLAVGFISLFVAIAVIGILSGLNISVLGSTVGISERSQKLVYNVCFYGGLWGIFSVMATVGLNGFSLFSLPIWGLFFYIILSLFYVLGVNQQIESNN